MLNCSRRGFLQAGTAAACGAALASAGSALRMASEQRQFIVVWLRGGLSPLDSFDPKPRAVAEIRGDAASIATAIPGVQFSEHFPRLAERLGKFCLVRGFVPDNDRHGLAEASLLSGTAAGLIESGSPVPAAYASQLAWKLGPREELWPNFQIGEQLDTRYGGGGAGELPSVTGPLVISNESDSGAVRYSQRRGGVSSRFPAGATFERLQVHCGPRPSLRRFEEAWRLLSDRLQQLHAADRFEAIPLMSRFVAAAHRWYVSPGVRKVLDLSSERQTVRDRYGMTATGANFLMARRLIEAGARCVTVTSGGWDLHADIASGMRNHGPKLDAGLAALLDDLDQRGLLTRTTVVCLSDFGRTPRLNVTGGRDHWSQTATCLLAGAGVPTGTVVGRTDHTGEYVQDQVFTPQDLATMIVS